MILEKIKKLNSRSKKYYIYPILFLALFLRLWDLNVRDLWYDEAFTGVAVKENFSSMLKIIINDIHPPLYYITLKIFASFFNYSVYGLRLFSVLFGVLAVFAVFLFTRKLFNQKVALFAAFITAINPFAIQYSQESRMYSMLSFLLLMAAYFFISALKTKSQKDYIWWGVFVGLACLTHYMGIIFSSLFYVAYVSWNILKEEEVNKKISFASFGKNFLPSREALIGLLTAGLIFSVWLKRFYYHIIDLGDNLRWVKPVIFSDIFSNIQMFLLGTPVGEMSSGMPSPNDLEGISRNSVLVFLVIFFVAIVFDLMHKEKRKTAIMLIFSFGFFGMVYAMSLFGEQYFVARYLLPGAYFIFILAGVWISQAKNYLKISLFMLYFIAMYFTLHLGFSTGWNILEKNTNKYENNNYYILNSFDYVIAKYYLGGNRLTLYNISWPIYNPSYWAAIGSSLRRVESFSEVADDPKAVIISNTPLDKKTSMDRTFDNKKLKLIDRYNNILIYRVMR